MFCCQATSLGRASSPLQNPRRIQAVVFSYEHDGVLKVGLKRRADFKSLMSQPPLSEMVDSIKVAMEDEAGPAKQVGPGDSGDEPNDEAEGDVDCTVLALDDLPEMKKMTKKLEEDDEKAKQLQYWKAHAKRLVEAHVELVSEQESDDVIVQKFKDSAAGKIRGNAADKSHVFFSYNPNLCGEASSQPCSRKPPLRQNGDHLRRACGLFMRARDWNLDERDIWCFFDGGREGRFL